jgi:hypothetical protein
MERTGIGKVLQDARRNALLGWTLVAFVVGVAAANLATGNVLWAGFAAAVTVLAVVPPVRYRDATAMLPFEVLLLAALPLLARTVAELATLRGDVAGYLSVAALALIIAVELHLLTPVRMTYRFAVAFVVVATMATAGLWAVVRFGADVFLGTTLVLPPGGLGASEEALANAEHRLMVEFVASFIAGVVAGVVFDLYFRRRQRGEEILPDPEEVL